MGALYEKFVFEIMTDIFSYPKPLEEIAKCKEYLMGGFSIPQQLQDIANRRRKVLEINLDDVLGLKNDLEFIDNIKRNTQRYITFFEEIAEKLLPEKTIQTESDVFDILKRQRLALNIPNAEDLVIHRFEVQINSSSAEKPRSIRELRADDIGSLIKVKGMVVRASDVKPVRL
jgi:DNA replication licensing factor MCM7